MYSKDAEVERLASFSSPFSYAYDAYDAEVERPASSPFQHSYAYDAEVERPASSPFQHSYVYDVEVEDQHRHQINLNHILIARYKR